MEVIIEIEKTDEVFLNTVIHETEPLAVYQSDSTGDASFCSVVFPLTPDSKRLFWIAWEKGNNIRIKDATQSYSVSISDRNRADRILNSFLEAEHSCIPDASEAETWLKRNHRIAPPMPIEVAHTRTDIFSDVLEMVRNEGSIEVKSFFYEGNGGTICYSPDTETLFCDLHFWDIAWIVAAALYVEKNQDDSNTHSKPVVSIFGNNSGIADDNISPMIANLIARDHLYCHGNHRKAVRFASAVKKDQDSLLQTIQHEPFVKGKIHELATHQLEYSIQRELLKLEPEKHNDIVEQVTRQRIRQWIDSFNEHRRAIARVDLTPIKYHLDILKRPNRVYPTWRIPSPEDVLSQYGHLVDLSGFPEDKQQQLLKEAADRYVADYPLFIISDDLAQRIIDYSVTQALVLKHLFNRRLKTMSVSESMKQALEALTMGFISERLSYISTHYRSGQDLRKLIRLEETQLCWAILIEEFPIILEVLGVVDNPQEYVKLHFDLLLNVYNMVFGVCNHLETCNLI